MKTILIEPNIDGYAMFPTMSLGILKGYINSKSKHRAEIIDFAFHKEDWEAYLLKKINEEKPDLIGFSVLTFNYTQALKRVKFIKKNFKVKIISGGVHCILSSEEVIKNKEIDIVCTGEGEKTMKELLDKSLNCKNIEGIWYKKGETIIKNRQRRLTEDLDELGFPEWDNFDLEKYFLINDNHLPIMASRGCPYDCTYCSNHALKRTLIGRYIRCRSVESVMEEIIKAMKDAGCYEVRMGYEAGNDYIRNEVYKRNMTKEQLDKAIKIVKKNGLQLRLTFIVGAPYENLDMMNESLRLAKKYNADYTLFPILVPIPGTDIRKICVQENLIEKDKFENFSDMFVNPIVRTKYVSRKQLQAFVNKIRMYQIKRYLLKGWKMKSFRFIADLFMFLYYKKKYKLRIDHAWRFTINKYNLEKLNRGRQVIEEFKLYKKIL